MNYIPATEQEKLEMIKEIGNSPKEQLFDTIPKNLQMKDDLNIPKGLTEPEVLELFNELAQKNTVFKTIFRGVGAYKHFIPSVVKHLLSRSEFVTAYTPYQPEMSQGVLQGIFEYQTMICELTAMDASNASVYDGGTAAAEAISMCRERKRNKALVSATVKPQNLEIIRTYCNALDIELEIISEKEGQTDLDVLKAMLNEETACVYTEQPNYYGILEDASQICQLTHSVKGKYIMGTYPISLALIKPPGEVGADIAVGEGQPLGMPLAFGGPYLGYMTCKKDMLRKLPGRIVGETTDAQGRRAFVLTLQAREQHIRREKASSSICSNQALCALTATVYLSALGQEGFKEQARQCASKAQYLAKKITEIDGFAMAYNKPFFNEFVTVSEQDTGILLGKLEGEGILGGYPLDSKRILWCATELNTKKEMDLVAEILKGASEAWVN